MSKSEPQPQDLSSVKLLDYKKDPSALWAFMIQKVLDFLPESERPNVPEVVNEMKRVMEESLACNSDFKGCRIPAPFSPKLGKDMYETWKPDLGDVLVVTYAKTGTTWMSAIVSSLLYKHDENMMKISSELNPFFRYLEGSYPSLHEAYKRLPLKNRVYCTHMLSDCVNIELLKQRGCKIIYVLRNPKDQLLSWYKFRLTLPLYDKGKMKDLHPEDWSEFFEKSITGQQWIFNKEGEWYPHHILSWYPYRNEEHVKFVFYEDLKKNPFSEIKEISKFLELDRTDEEIHEIVEETSFQSMHKKMKSVNLTRKGIIGDWKNQFTVAQSELMDEKFKEVLKDVDIKFAYE